MSYIELVGRIKNDYDELMGIESLEKQPNPSYARKALIQLRDALNEVMWNRDFFKKLQALQNHEEIWRSMQNETIQPIVYDINFALAFDSLGGDVRVPITTIVKKSRFRGPESSGVKCDTRDLSLVC